MKANRLYSDALDKNLPFMETVEHCLAEPQAIVNRVERENRGITEKERQRVEEALKRAGQIRDNSEFTNKIARFNAEFSGRGSSGSGGFGATVVSSGWDLKSRPSVDIPVASILTKANSFPAVGEWAPVGHTTSPWGG